MAAQEAYITGIGQSAISVRATRSPFLLTLDAIREALDAWQRQRVSFMDGLRRQRVANQIRRAWRRKNAGIAGDDFVVHIDGEQVGSLPTMPA